MPETPGPADRLEQLDYYTLLGVDDDASSDRIREAFHRFALKYHPDRHVGGPSEKVQRAAQIFRRGAEGYRVLLDPEARRRYDLQLRNGKVRYDPAVEDMTRSKRPGSGVLSVTSPKARTFFQKGDQAVRAKDWQTAKLNFQLALRHEPNNQLLEARLAMVESELRKK